MKRKRRNLHLMLPAIAALGPGAALGQAYAHPQCPWVNPANSWVDYISGRVDRDPSQEVSYFYFQVRFDQMSHIADSRRFTGASDPMGTLWKGSCYTVYFQNGAWHVAGYNEQAGETRLFQYSNADPTDYEISLWGRVFEYNEAGELFDPDYGLVGSFHCILWNRACEGFRD